MTGARHDQPTEPPAGFMALFARFRAVDHSSIPRQQAEAAEIARRLDLIAPDWRTF